MLRNNDELKELHDQVARKKQLEVVLQDLWVQEQELVPKIAELEQANRYPGWKVGDFDNPITDGNFE